MSPVLLGLLVLIGVAAFICVSVVMGGARLRNEAQDREEEARAVRALTSRVLLTYHPKTFQILTGTFRGQDVHDTCQQFERAGYRSRPVHVRPWTRAWRLTPAFHLERRP